MNIANLLLELVPNITNTEAYEIQNIIVAIYSICVAVMAITLLYYTGLLFWKIHHSNSEEEIKYLKKHYFKRIIAFICFLFLFVVMGIILSILAPIIKTNTTS